MEPHTQRAVVPAGGPAAAAAAMQYLAFTLNGEQFAIDIMHIREIIEFGAITTVPMAPPSVRGVINLRGAVVPVIDLSARFCQQASAVARRSCIVITEIECDGQMLVLGIMVDAVNAVLEIPEADIEPPPAFGTRVRTDFIAGMARVDGRFVIILKAGKVLSIDELAQLEKMSDALADAA